MSWKCHRNILNFNGYNTAKEVDSACPARKSLSKIVRSSHYFCERLCLRLCPFIKYIWNCYPLYQLQSGQNIRLNGPGNVLCTSASGCVTFFCECKCSDNCLDKFCAGQELFSERSCEFLFLSVPRVPFFADTRFHRRITEWTTNSLDWWGLFIGVTVEKWNHCTKLTTPTDSKCTGLLLIAFGTRTTLRVRLFPHGMAWLQRANMFASLLRRKCAVAVDTTSIRRYIKYVTH